MSSSLEGNKTLAAILTAGIFAVGAGVVSGMIYSPAELDEPAYAVELASAEVEPVEVEATPLPILLASADAAAGEKVAKKCASCHNFDEGGGNKVGPALHGVVGRSIGSAAGFSYSDAIGGHGGEWDYESLNGFLTSPKGWAPGTAMSFNGISKEGDRADLIVYLKSVSPDAPELPAVDAAPSEEAAADPAQEAVEAVEDEVAETTAEATEAVEKATEAVAEEAESVVAEATEDASETAAAVVAAIAPGDIDAGAKVARKCKACHSFDEGGKAKVGPPLWGVVGRDIASIEGFGYSGALSGKDGVWNAAHLDAFLTAPKDWAAGTKMAFSGLRKDEDRANIIAYLSSLAN